MLLPILYVLAAVSSCVVPTLGQQHTCQTEILHNSTVDIDKYLNKELHIVATFTTPPPDAVSNCTLQCCNQDNCSLAVYNASDNHMCILIHCVSEDACKPLPLNGSEMVKTMRNSITTTENLPENQSISIENSHTTTTPSSSASNTPNLFTGDKSTSSQQTTTQDDSTGSFYTTTDPHIENETESSNYTITYVTPNSSEYENISVTGDENVTFTLSNSTLDDSTESFSTTSYTLIKNESDNLNYTNTYLNSNSSTVENFVVTIDANFTFPQSNDTVNSTIDSDQNQNSTQFPNITFSKQEANLKNKADESNTLMISVLVGTLSIGTFLFVAIIVVISKKIIDGWQKRHYSRIDYLVNGMYN